MADKIFRDPLFNYISICHPDRWLVGLLDCPEVQRLRRIHQLGVCHFTYPGAEHSRLSHSLGVLHLIMEATRHMHQTNGDDPQLRNAREPLLAAALLHDVGHGPFSHLSEPCLEIKHEDWSAKIITDSQSGVNKELRKIDASLPGRVAGLIQEDNQGNPSWAKHLLSSQVDVDRLDFLMRDSLFTGAGYGHFDWYRILHTFQLHGEMSLNRDLVWPEKAMYPIEEFIFARFYMYQAVYMHKTTRGFEKMIQAMWQYARQLRKNGTDVNLAKPISAFWGSSDPSVGQYLALEEHVLLYQIQCWTEHPDKALSDLARRFLHRRRFAAIEAPRPENELADLSEWEEALAKCVSKQGFKCRECYVLRDDMKGITIYDPYFPEKETEEQVPGNAIRILDRDTNKPVEISQRLVRLKAVVGKRPPQVRYYVPLEARQAVEKLRRKWV